MIILNKSKAIAAIAIMLIVIIVYVLLPINVYGRKVSGTIAGFGTVLEDTFVIPPLKQTLRVRITGNITGVFNVTIVDQTENSRVFLAIYLGYEYSFYDDRMLSISHMHTYKITVTGSGAYVIDIKLIAYPF